MPSTSSGLLRSTSVSSTRRISVPASCFANSQLKSAVRAPPTCRYPVGEGAKRTRMASCVLSVISPVLLARPALLFQTSSLAKPLCRVQSGACPVQNGRIRPASRARLPSLVWKPLPPSLLPLWQPVPRYACFLKFPSSIITTTLLCAPRCPPRDAAGLSLRASRFRFHRVARSASPCLHGATEPSVLGTEN